MGALFYPVFSWPISGGAKNWPRLVFCSDLDISHRATSFMKNKDTFFIRIYKENVESSSR